MVIEDECSLLKVLCEQLSSEECEVLSALDGKSGLKIIQKQKPDLVLLDVVLHDTIYTKTKNNFVCKRLNMNIRRFILITVV